MGRFDTSMHRGGPPFPQTSWSLIRLAQDPNAPAYRAGLDSLIRKYWGPVYLYIRRRWAKQNEEAKDLTQAFFLAFLEKDFLASVQSEKGKFRSFVQVALRHFLTKQKRDANALKRCPQGGLLSLDDIVERAGFAEPADPSTVDAEAEFQDDWKRAVLEAALAALHARAHESGKSACVTLLMRCDLDPPPEGKPSYEELAKELGLTVYQVTNGLHWARKEFRALVLKEIEDQVATQEDLREEARELLGLKVD